MIKNLMHSARSTRHMKSGYSLLELAIVLTIIALIIVSLLFGYEMIAQAQLKRTVEAKMRLDTQVRLFEARYLALPGDFANYDGALGSVNSGNQNGYVCYTVSTSPTLDEVNNVHPHLSASGILDRSYSVGTLGNNASPYTLTIGTNVPSYQGLESTAIWFAAYPVDQYGRSACTQNTYYLTGTDIQTGAVSLEDAIQLDTKYDDGFAATGTIRAYRPAAGKRGTNDCVDADMTAPSASYLNPADVSEVSKQDCILEMSGLE